MTVTRSTVDANYLQNYLYKKTLENFEPELYFHKMGEKPTVPSGYGTVSWTKFGKLSLTAAQTLLQEGQTPTSAALTTSTIVATPTQYGIYVELSDRILKVSPVNILDNASKEVGNNMARIIDQVIQTEVMAGTNVIYSDVSANSARTDLASTDIITASLLRKAYTKLDSNNAPKMSGYYVGIFHPFQVGDLKAETTTGGWIDTSKYSEPQNIFKGEIGALHGVRIVSSSNVQTFASTVTVYPALVIGGGAYGVTDFSSLEMIYQPVGSGNDPLKQRATVGAKVDFVAKRLQEDAMVRLETAATSV